MANESVKQQTIPSFEEFKANVTGDYKKFNDEALKAIYEGHYKIGVTKFKDIDEFKEKLFNDED
ncbi:MAG: hypothetical protein GY760_04815 [Deltaproteobacteria bacterium]|nr:hypothetical protein [Deltaproteobacteria bacterium]